ncbi:ABC transporter substrate-binding protein [Azospirillum sp. INR13]|uniref:ABC transporter substrate-binding protein n=1 Tax=Azospirillum sp. INR13 TaxID=2596919 RepID=UPI001891F560|nr:ABC transporter substrate-binding protein [Azospirillum sp. INR13]
MSVRTGLRTTLQRLLGAAVASVIGLSVQAAEPFKIGAYLSETGPAANLGAGEMKALKLFSELLNKEGGIAGRPIELFAYDDESDPAKANTIVKRLISNDKVSAIIGGTTTGATLSSVPLVERAKIPMLSCAGGGAIVEPLRPTVFKMNPTDAVAVERILTYIAAQGLTKLAIIAGNDAFGQSATAAARKLSGPLKLTIVAEEFFNPKDTDMTTQLTKLRQSGAEAILNAGFGDAAAIVAKNLKQLDIKLPHFGTHAIATEGFLKLAGPSAEGMAIPSGAILVWEQLPASHPQRPVLERFVTAYNGKYGEAPSYFAGNAYDALMLIKQAAEAGGSDLRTNIETAALVGATGTFRMSASDHVGLGIDSIVVARAKGGKWELVE